MTTHLSFAGVPLHEDDYEHALTGRPYFAVLEHMEGRPATLRLQRLIPRDVRGRAKTWGLLGAFGEKRDGCVARFANGAVILSVGTDGQPALIAYPTDDMVAESRALASRLGLTTRRQESAHAH